jgi:hypothetical protein
MQAPKSESVAVTHQQIQERATILVIGEDCFAIVASVDVLQRGQACFCPPPLLATDNALAALRRARRASQSAAVAQSPRNSPLAETNQAT